jgi:hypothetical protein
MQPAFQAREGLRLQATFSSGRVETRPGATRIPHLRSGFSRFSQTVAWKATEPQGARR